MISLAMQDVGRARCFVERVLGELAGGGEADARLRETLSVDLAARWNHRETARRLSLHHNTVIYRLQQIESKLGRPLDDNPVELQLAGIAVPLAG